jgi:uncharacterized lipoprotein YmbA
MKNEKVAAVSAALLLATFALAGCGSPPRDRFYTLSANVDARPVSQDAAAQYGVVIGPVTIPEVVDRPQMVVLMAGSQVSLAEQSRWAEPLAGGISRVIADNLVNLLPDARVSAFPQSRTVVADYRVMVDVQHFDSTIGEGVRDEFLWVVRAANKEGVTRSGRTIAREEAKSGEYAEQVAAHNRALEALSRDIAMAIRTMQ